jgi:integrase
MGLADLEQAELKNLTWHDVDLVQNPMRVRRVKTGRFFDVPIYPQLRPLLERLHAERGDSERVLKISDGKRL